MTELFLLAKEFGPAGITVFICTIILIKQNNKVDKDQCSKNRAELYDENKEILQVLNEQTKANEREFGEIQATLKAIDKNLDRMNGG